MLLAECFFFSESEDNRFDYGTYQLSDSGYEAIKESGFKMHLLELIDTLLVYRAQHKQPATVSRLDTRKGKGIAEHSADARQW